MTKRFQPATVSTWTPREPVLSWNARGKGKRAGADRALPLLWSYVTVTTDWHRREVGEGNDDAEGSGHCRADGLRGGESRGGARHAWHERCRAEHRDGRQRRRVFPRRHGQPMALPWPGGGCPTAEDRQRVRQCVHREGSRDDQGCQREGVSRYQPGEPRSLRQLLSAGCRRYRLLWFRTGHRARKAVGPVSDRSISARVPVLVSAIRSQGSQFRQRSRR